MKTPFYKNLRFLPAIALLSGLGVAAPITSAVAQTLDRQTTVIYEGSRVRVNLAGQLRHMTQEVGAAACSLNAGYDRIESMARLGSARAEFDNLFAALSHGNSRLGVPSREGSTRVKRALTQLLKVWASSSVTTQKMFTRDDISALSDVVAANTQQQAIATQRVADEFIAEYSDPSELLTADALTIAIVGRQMQLIRQMERLTCAMLNQDTNYGDLSDMTATISLFEETLLALAEGRPNAGVIAPPNRAVTQQIETVQTAWNVQAAALEGALVSPQQDSEAKWIALRDGYDGIFNEAETLVVQYLLAAPGRNDSFKFGVSTYADEELVSWAEFDELVQSLETKATAPTERTLGFFNIRIGQSKGLVADAIALDNGGSVVVATNGLTVDRLSGFSDFAADEISVSNPQWNDARGNYEVLVSLPVSGEAAKVGTLVLILNLQPFL